MENSKMKMYNNILPDIFIPQVTPDWSMESTEWDGLEVDNL